MEEIDWAQSIIESNFLINENRQWVNIKYEGSKWSVLLLLSTFLASNPRAGKSQAKSTVLTPPEAM